MNRLSLRNIGRAPALTWLFYAGLVLCLLGGQRFNPTDLMPVPIAQIQQVLRRIGMILLGLRLLSLFPAHPRYTFNCLALLFLFLVSHILSGRGTPGVSITFALVVAASRGTDLKLTLKLYLAYLLFFLVCGPATLALGWTAHIYTHLGALRGVSCGLSNPNALAALLAGAATLGLYLSGKRSVPAILGVCLPVAALTFILTLCTTQAVALLLLPPLYFFFRKTGPRAAWLTGALPIVCLAVSVLLSCYYGPGYGSSTFESRFSIPALVYERFGLSPFGQDCGLRDWFSGQSDIPALALDNTYLSLLLCSGVIPGLVCMALLCACMLLIGKKGDPLLSAIAVCVLCASMMEKLPFNIIYCFLPLFFGPLLEEASPGDGRKVSAVSAALALGAALYAFMPWQARQAEPRPYGTLKDIPCPDGFLRVEYPPDSFPAFVEELPLARPDSVLAGYDGASRDSLAPYCYRVLDAPLINEDEQCADVCMHLWAEYQYRENRFRRIRFADTRGRTLRYHFGACRGLFVQFLKKAFAWGNTESLRRSLPVRELDALAPGDVLVYDKDSRPGEKYGHAVMVAGVAVDTVCGRRAVLIIQGSTPACDVHLVANPAAPGFSPWYVLEAPGISVPEPVITVGRAVFYPEDLHRFMD